MSTYRFYGITRDSRIAARPQLWEGDNDAAACDQALTALGELPGAEVWQGARLVGRVWRDGETPALTAQRA